MIITKKISASGIAEVVIAMSIIAICIGLFSVLFVRSTNNQFSYLEVKMQTEIQDNVFSELVSGQKNNEEDKISSEAKIDYQDQFIVRKSWTSTRGLTLWIQEFTNANN